MEDHKNDIIKMVKDGLSETSIIRRLTQNGISEDVAKEDYYDVLDTLQRDYTTKNRFIWLAVLVAVLLAGFFLIPFKLTATSPIFYGSVLGIFVSLGLLQSIEVFDSFSTFWQTCTVSDYHRKPKMHIALVLFMPVIFSVAGSIYYTWEFKHEMAVNGIQTWGKITKAERITPVNDSNITSGPISHQILIQFALNDEDVPFEKYFFVTENQFENAHLGDSLPLVYSKRIPEEFTVDVGVLDSTTNYRWNEYIEEE